MSDIFLCDEKINSNQLDEKLIKYNNEVYKYWKLLRLYKSQLEVYKKLVMDFKLEANKQKVILEEYKRKVGTVDKYLCKICFEEYVNCLIMPCMHFVSCKKCIEKIQDNNCPLCRNPFLEYLEIFS